MPRLIFINNLLPLIINLVIVIFLLNGCATGTDHNRGSLPVTLINNKINISELNKQHFIEYPIPSDFSICYGHTCQKFARVSLGTDEWNSIRGIFAVKSGSADIEREKIRDAVSMMEQVVGEKTGTFLDKGENFPGLGMPGQMDCVDESTNTTVYLTMFQNDGLLDWHNVTYRESRGILSLQAPHFTAVIQQKDNNKKYVVDSWFLDNGEKPFILPLKEWKSGWSPP